MDTARHPQTVCNEMGGHIHAQSINEEYDHGGRDGYRIRMRKPYNRLLLSLLKLVR